MISLSFFWLWLALTWIALFPANARYLSKKDADFYSVRTRLAKDRSGKGGDPKQKYFHESTFHPHLDGRFADRELSYYDRKQCLSAMMQTYLASMADFGVETWLMHGSLLGWWWNQKILPWDSDVDVQVSESSMYFLASFYNMTTHHYKTAKLPEGRTYMLEINPHYVNRGTDDKFNVIDARWIDTETGMFIDITTVRKNETAEAEGIEGALMCKDKHHYLEKEIFPLRQSLFEDTPALVPYAYVRILQDEYGNKALTRTTYQKISGDIVASLERTIVPRAVWALARGVRIMRPIMSLIWYKAPMERNNTALGAAKVGKELGIQHLAIGNRGFQSSDL